MAQHEIKESSSDKPLKLVIVGDAAVGKTNLIRVMSGLGFDPNAPPTLVVEFVSKNFVINGVVYPAQIWDTAGQERFRGLPHLYYRNASAVAIAFDVSDRASFDHVPHWIDEVHSHCPREKVPTILVGTKGDRLNHQVQQGEAIRLAEKMQVSLGYVETSAPNNAGIFMVFQRMVEGAVAVEQGAQANLSQRRFGKRLSKDSWARERASSLSQDSSVRRRMRDSPVDSVGPRSSFSSSSSTPVFAPSTIPSGVVVLDGMEKVKPDRPDNESSCCS